MTKTISDLPNELLEDKILSKVPSTSLRSMRSTCKLWNALLRNQFFAKFVEARKLSFMLRDSRVCTMQPDLQRISNECNFVDHQLIKQVKLLDEIKVSQIYYCEGLMLCILQDNSSLVVWNPYLGQTRWIQSMNEFDRWVDTYALGYDNNHNHKVLRFFEDFDYSCAQRHELYDFNLNSWKVLDEASPNWDASAPQRGGKSLKGNAYFFVQGVVDENAKIKMFDNYLLCFDFTSERFGERLPLPFHSYDGEVVTFSCVREEQFAVLYNRVSSDEEPGILKIWVTNMIDPSAVSWSKFLEVDLALVNGNLDDMKYFSAGSFFIDEEKKAAMVLKIDKYDHPNFLCRYHTAYIIKAGGYFKSMNIREAPNVGTLVCSSFVPSLVQVRINQRSKHTMHRGTTAKKPKRIKRTIHCSQCGQAGHNSRRCGKRTGKA